MSAGAFNIGGNDWLGLGAALESNTVEGCGSRPLFDSAGQKIWNECVQSQNQLKSQATQSNTLLQKSQMDADAKKQIALYAVIAIVLIIVLVFIFKKKKSK